MKPIKAILSASLLSSLAINSLAQGFSSGSSGVYGPLIITSNTTLALPDDGFLHCTSINVAQGATLSFKRNPNNTPVYLLATTNVTINGVIDISGQNSVASIPDGGQGGPGGFDGGKPGFGTVPPGDGLGPGGGKGGVYLGFGGRNDPNTAGGGSYGSTPTDYPNAADGPTYGSPLLIPVIGGSGGGGTIGQPGRGGGGGGGAILIASSTRIDVGASGRVFARGGGNREASGADYPLLNPGSGGAIRLVAPIVAGTGELNVLGGNFGYAGHGRIRVDSIVRTALQFNFQPASVTSVGSTMMVFPSPLPRLDILGAANQAIAEGSGPVYVQLPYNSPTNQTVTVQARNFNSVVPIRVVLTPDNGSQSSFDAAIDNRAANPAQTIVNINMPVNVQVTINVWTR